jgi:hypothetical protein
MYFKQSELDKTTNVVSFCIKKKTFTFNGVEFQIYPDKHPKRQAFAIKRNDYHKRISALFPDPYNTSKYYGDVVDANKEQKRKFSIEIFQDKSKIRLDNFAYAIELIGINIPVEQIDLFTEPLGTSKSTFQDTLQTHSGHSQRGIYVVAISKDNLSFQMQGM